MLPTGALQISKASVSDSGSYMCVAQNPAGTALAKTKLRVQGKSNTASFSWRSFTQVQLDYVSSSWSHFLPAVPPVIRSLTQSYLVPLDTSATLQGRAEGSPLPTVAWHKDGHPLAESLRQRVLSSGALQIAFAQHSDTGRYTCTEANAAGTASLVMSLTVQSEFVQPAHDYRGKKRLQVPWFCMRYCTACLITGYLASKHFLS